MTTYGIELEFCASIPIREFVKFLQKKKINIFYVDPKQPTANYWKAEKDYSVLCNGKNRFGSSLKLIEQRGQHADKMHAMEIVSPVLKTYKSLSEYLKKMHSLNITYSINQTQGFHIHLSNNHLQLPKFNTESFGTQWITAFCINWTVFEDIILSMHHPNRLVSPHARSLRDNLNYGNRFKEFDTLDSNDASYSFDYIYKMFNPARKNYGSGKVYPKGPYHNVNLSHGRNSVVNLANLRIDKLGRKGTIEIRSHEGTVDPKAILLFVKMMKKFFESCYNKKTKKFIDARLLVEKKTGKSYKVCKNDDLHEILFNYINLI
tara:strand:+ start:2143 stop:3099 length:957 start_codon:yes stop_codon:yes gene_type:complete